VNFVTDRELTGQAPAAQYAPARGDLLLMRWIRTLLPLLLACAASAIAAQRTPNSTPGHEAFFRCKDASGQTHYGDSMPPACQGLDTEVLTEHGSLVRVIEGEHTRTTRLQREAVEDRVNKERAVRAQRDRVLIDTYLTVEDIERLRDQRLELLVAQYRLTETNIANLKERQGRLEGQIARFKPYSDNPSALPLPDHLAEEMVNTVNGLQVYQETLQKNRKEQADVKSSFGSDIKRFKELKGVK
jgi:hypothetical protein